MESADCGFCRAKCKRLGEGTTKPPRHEAVVIYSNNGFAAASHADSHGSRNPRDSAQSAGQAPRRVQISARKTEVWWHKPGPARHEVQLEQHKTLCAWHKGGPAGIVRNDPFGFSGG